MASYPLERLISCYLHVGDNRIQTVAQRSYTGFLLMDNATICFSDFIYVKC